MRGKRISVGRILAVWLQNWKLRENGDMAFEKSYIGNPHLMKHPPIGAIAIPIITADGIHGSLSLLCLEEHLSADTVIQSGLLERLKAWAGDISTKTIEGSIPPPV